MQGFTQSIAIAVNGCDTVTCTNVNCGCTQAYPPGVSVLFCGLKDIPTFACRICLGVGEIFRCGGALQETMGGL